MSTIYDDVERDARDDHRHNPPGFARRPTGKSAARVELEVEEYRHDASFGAFDERDEVAS